MFLLTVSGASLSDAGSAGNDSPEEVENVQDNYSVLAEEADAKVLEETKREEAMNRC